MRRLLPLAALGMTIAAAAVAWPVTRGIVEDGTDTSAAEGATDGGVTLVNGNGTTRLRPATCASSSCTRVAPDAGSEGLSIQDIASWRLTLCAPNDQVLTASGKAEVWLYDPVISQWGHMGAKDVSVTLSDHCQAFPVELNGMQASGFRILFRPNGVGTSGNDGGSALTSTQACGNNRAQAGCGP